MNRRILMYLLASAVATAPAAAGVHVGGGGGALYFGSNQDDTLLSVDGPDILVGDRGEDTLVATGTTNGGFTILIGGFPFIEKVPPTGIHNSAWQHDRDFLLGCTDGLVALEGDDGDDTLMAMCGDFFDVIGEGKDDHFLFTSGSVTFLTQAVDRGLDRDVDQQYVYGRTPDTFWIGYPGVDDVGDLILSTCEDVDGSGGTGLRWPGLGQNEIVCFVGATAAQVEAIQYVFASFFPTTAATADEAVAAGTPDGKVGLAFAGYRSSAGFLQ